MHIFLSGIGGGGLGPLAVIAKQAGYDVSGSDKQDSSYIAHLRAQGIGPYIGQTEAAIARLHAEKPIDWLVYSSAVPKENPDHPELRFAEAHGIRHSKRDELLGSIIADHNLKLIAVAGTHGKTTTTAMIIWLFKQLAMPLSYSVGAKIPFGPMGQFDSSAPYFVYECDEFDRNFLAFHPEISVITGIGWDHHEIFPSAEDYNQAFRTFIGQSRQTILWDRDAALLGIDTPAAVPGIIVEQTADTAIHDIGLYGKFNREDAWMAIRTVMQVSDTSYDTLSTAIGAFPGLKQRMELLAPNLYTNYAHTPEKIRGGISTALEIAAATKQKLIVIYEPLTNRRQHYIKVDYKDCFEGADKLYWVPSYLAREDPTLPLLSPGDLIPYLTDPSIAEPAKLDDSLLRAIKQHLADGDLVVAIGASGGGSMDEWLRQQFTLTDTSD